MLAILFPSRSFAVASAMIRNLSGSGMDKIAANVGALRRSLSRRAGRSPAVNTFALCLIDGLSFAEESVTSAIHWGLDDIPLIGGSAGDDLKFETTTLICDGIVDSDCAVVILVATDVPFHVFKTENFVPTDEKLVVTASDPDRRIVHEFNASGRGGGVCRWRSASCRTPSPRSASPPTPSSCGSAANITAARSRS